MARLLGIVINSYRKEWYCSVLHFVFLGITQLMNQDVSLLFKFLKHVITMDILCFRWQRI
jgi:hypothetical protein